MKIKFKKIFFFLVLTLILAVFIVGSYNAAKPLSPGISTEGEVYFVPSSSIDFLYDVTYVDQEGVRHSEQEIFDEVIKMIGGAEKYILLDMFLFNNFQGKVLEKMRPLSEELTNALVSKKQQSSDINIILISDPINTVYGSMVSPHFTQLEKAGINIIITDLKKIKDSNFVYSALWRTFFRWFGNSELAGIAPNPFIHNGERVTLRTYLALLNFKANHRKLIVADKRAGDELKMSTLVTSANPHDGSSAHTNVAIKIDDYIWRDIIKNEKEVAEFSGTSIPGFVNGITDKEGDVTVQMLTEGKIREKLIKTFSETGAGDNIDIAMFYLSDRKIIKALLKASTRGAEIRLALDSNKDAFGHQKNGVPNRPVASELINKSLGNIQIRWCDTHGEQCHSKMILVKNNDGYNMFLGSANLTKRNIGDYNLETDILVYSKNQIEATSEAYDYFDKIWDNSNGKIYTVDYEEYKDESFLKLLQYRFQEVTGMGSF